MAQSANLPALAPDPEEATEYLTIDSPPGTGTVEDDGKDGWLVTVGEQLVPERESESGEFYANLADEVVPDQVLDKIATDLLQKIDEDKEARKPRDDQYDEGIRRTGIGKDAPGGAPFDGASRVVHPMLTEACADFTARIMRELWPPSGPVKARILGEVTKKKADRAKKKVDWMNEQLNGVGSPHVIKEARSVVETMLSQLPLGGTQLVKIWWDHRLRRPRMQFCPVDKIYLPENASDYHSSDRKTFADVISAAEMKRRMNSGMYREVKLGPAPMKPEQSKTEESAKKAEGVTSPGLNIDGDREIYEVSVGLEISDEMAEVLGHEEAGEIYPYILTIDVTSRKILCLYRDWEQDDPGRDSIEHYFAFDFLAWRGALKLGLPGAIGGLAGGATGALRALLDSAFIANSQGGLVLKGSGTGAQARRANPNEFIEIESGLETSDIREKVMQFNTKEPSTVLFQLLGFLVEAGKNAVRTSMEDTSIDATSNVPVGTQQIRVSEGLVVFSNIHARMHASFNRLLAGLHRLNRLYLPTAIKAELNGEEVLIRRRDFQGTPDIQPTADPTVFTDQQRLIQVTAMQQRSMVVQGLYNQREVEGWFLDLMKVPDKDRFLVPAPQPHELNAVNENLAMALGRPVMAFPDQDHLAHLQAHFDFADSPMLGSNEMIAPRFMPAFVQHCVEHICYHYVSKTTQVVEHYTGSDVKDLFSKDAEVKAELDRLLAQASQLVVPSMVQDFAKAQQVLAKAMQVVKSLQPPPPQDPAAVAGQAAAAETNRKTQTDQGNLQLKSKQIDAQAQAEAERNAINAERVEAMKDNAAVSADTALRRTEMETETARDIEAARIESGQGAKFKDGASLGANV